MFKTSFDKVLVPNHFLDIIIQHDFTYGQVVQRLIGGIKKSPWARAIYGVSIILCHLAAFFLFLVNL